MCTFDDFCVFTPVVWRSDHKRALFIAPVAPSLKLSTIGRALHLHVAKMWVLLTHQCCGYQRIRANVWMINRSKVIFSYLPLTPCTTWSFVNRSQYGRHRCWKLKVMTLRPDSSLASLFHQLRLISGICRYQGEPISVWWVHHQSLHSYIWLAWQGTSVQLTT